MADDTLEVFARLLVADIRDAAIGDTAFRLSPGALGPGAKAWRKAIKARGEVPKDWIIADAVDAAIFRLCHLLDADRIRLSIVDENGQARPLDFVNGELAGDYLGDWRQRLSARPLPEE